MKNSKKAPGRPKVADPQRRASFYLPASEIALLQHEAGDESPSFVPEIDLLWYPTDASLTLDDSPTLDLRYGDVATSVTAVVEDDDSLTLTYRADAPAGQRVEAHVPLLHRPGTPRLGDGERVRLGEDDLLLTSEPIGGSLFWSGLEVSIPDGASLRWPAWQHNPYTKDGHSSIGSAKMVIVLPFGDGVTERSVTVRHRPRPGFDGLAFEARDLPVTSETGPSAVWPLRWAKARSL